MSHKNQDELAQFNDLTKELADIETKGVQMPVAAKRKLRQKLLAHYEDSNTLSRQDSWNLFRFASSVAGVAILGLVVFGFWLAISQSRPSIAFPDGESGVSITPTPSDFSEVTEAETAVFTPTPLTIVTPPVLPPLNLPTELGDHFNLVGYEVAPKPLQPGQPFQLLLFWETTGRPSANYTAFVHVLDQNGNLVAQADKPLGETSTFVNGTMLEKLFAIWLPEELADGRYQLITGLYDGTTGQQIPQLDNRSGLYLGEINVASDTDAPPYALVYKTDGNGVHLRRAPGGQSIAILADDAVVQLTDAPRQELDGLIWQEVISTDGFKGWVAADFLSYPNRDTLSNSLVTGSPDQVWITHIRQGNRATTSGSITIDLTLGVDLQSVDEAVLKISYAHPDWQSVEAGRVPIDSLVEDQVVTSGMDSVTVTAVLNPNEAKTITGTDAPVLVVQLGIPSVDQNGQPFFDTLYSETGPAWQIYLQEVSEIEQRIGIETAIQFESIRQEQTVTAVTLEVTANFEGPNGTPFQLLLVNPDLATANVDNALYFQPVRGNLYRLTATAEQIREATGTDFPVVLGILHPDFISTTQFSTSRIVKPFEQCPFDLTQTETITCPP